RNSGLQWTQGTEPATSVSQQNQTDPGILAGTLGIHTEEILREEDVLVPVAIEVGDADTERWRELGRDGQRPGVEMVTTVQKNHRIERGGLQFAGASGLVTEHLLHAGATIDVMVGHTEHNEWNGGGDHPPLPPGGDF